MNKHYTFVDIVGSRIFHRYWDNGPKQEVTDSFPIQLFIKGKRQDSVGLFGETLSRIDFTDISDAREFVSEHSDVTPIFGQTSFAHQFISNTYPGDVMFDMSHFKIVVFDIETDMGLDMVRADKMITSITVKILGKDGFTTFGMKEFKPADGDTYYRENNEEQLLARFLTWWMTEKPDIVTGWNVIGYDIPYLINRMKQVLGEKVTCKLSPFHQHTTKVFTEYKIQGDQTSYRILGVTVFDYLELYKKFARGAQESYRLDWIAFIELGEQKIDYSGEYKSLADLYERNHQLYCEYNVHDVRLVENLDKKLKYIFNSLTLAFVGKVRLHEIFGQVKFWDCVIYNHLLKKNIQIPPESGRADSDGISGAFVKEPKPGLYHWVVSFDLTSLYPSIMMLANMSPETLVDCASDENILEDMICMKHDLSYAIEKNVAVAANGSSYTREKHGMLPEIITGMFGMRKSYKNKMLACKKEAEKMKADHVSDDVIHEKYYEAERYDALQNAFKIALNSCYGATANANFRYFNTSIAEGITMTGQCIIRYIGNSINRFMNSKLGTENEDYVIASDTDSVYIHLGGFVDKVCGDADINKKIDFVDKFGAKFIEPFLAEEFAKLEKYLNVYTHALHMKREAIGDKAVWRGKKNYIMQVWDNEGVRYQEADLKTMGVETARSSTPKIVKDALLKCYDILLNGNESQLIEFVKEFKVRFMTAPLDEIAFPRGVTDMDKWVDGRTAWKLGTPIHVKSAIVYNMLIQKHKMQKEQPLIKNGDKIKFIYLKQPNVAMCNVVGFPDKLHAEFELNNSIDKDTQFEKTFMGPLLSFAKLVGMQAEYVATLDDFFSDDDAVQTVQISQDEFEEKERDIIIKEKAKKVKVVVKNDEVIIRVKPKKRQPASLDDFFE